MPRPPLLSDRAVALKPSLTLAISARAKQLQREGRDICSLSAGEPDFKTPDFIVEAAQKALADGFTRYGPAAGDPELRAAIAEKLSKENCLKTASNQVLVTNGGKQAIYNLFQVILNPGSEVLIPAPYWLSYPEMARLAGATPVLIPSSAKHGFKLDFNALEQAIGPQTRLLILNSPGNPTGSLLTLEDLHSLASILRRHPNVLVMTDEIYEYLLAEGLKHHSFAAVAPDLADRVFTVNGFAKGWAMTGWRIGYLSGDATVIQAAAALQSQSTSNVCSFAQRGALAALQGPRDCVEVMARTFEARRNQMTTALNSIDGLTVVKPQGAFYVFPQLPDRCPDSVEFCNRALESFGLAIVPGLAFGDDRCVRLSCAVSPEAIDDGLERLNRLLAST